MSIFFTIPGNPEYVLHRSGLFDLRDREPQPSEKLTRLFYGKPIPPLAELLPALIRLAVYCNMERGGALNVERERVEATEGLKSLGLTHDHGALHATFQAVRQATDLVAEEIKLIPPPQNL
ncbi:hypothetical protein V5E97_15450 [Singulisphaera sp. Ch08]|uniref:Uncharacterized protein n=1 Tax=Singulisphaera sp. Ch08 TaxID=3120278 RepID=A0AAU7CRT7_9BACT